MMDHELLVSPHDNIAAVAADNDAVECRLLVLVVQSLLRS